MKRRLYLLWLLLAVCLWADAHHLNEQQALQRVQSLLPGKTFSVAACRGLSRPSASHADEAALYVLNAAEGGFAIASADDRVPPILGYGNSGHLTPDCMPPCVSDWIESYAEQIASITHHSPVTTHHSPPLHPVSPLLGETAWGQYRPFYNKCPVYDGSHCNTGCVATAMAQIMYCHRWPQQTTCEIPGYYTAALEFDMPSIPVTTIDWENILPTYQGISTQAQRDAVAELMLLCGTAVEMNYTPGASGSATLLVEQGLQRYFDYAPTTVTLNRSYYSNDSWEQIIWKELSEGRPVLYSANTFKSPTGHAFVIDGYDGNGFFHVNWGWEGEGNGYFMLSILDPLATEGIDAYSSSDGYSRSQGAVIGIQKNEGQQAGPLVVMDVMNVKLPDGDTFLRSSMEEPFLPSMTASIWNLHLGKPLTFDMGFGLFSADDEFIGLVGGSYTEKLDYGTGYSAFGGQFPLGAGVAEATYKLKPVSRLTGYSEWQPDESTTTYYVLAEIKGNTLKLTAPFIDLSGTLALVGEAEARGKCFAKATITNNGTDFNQLVYFLLDGKEVGFRQFSVAAGQTADLNFSYIPQETGDKTLSIATEQWQDDAYVYTTIATCTVNVQLSSVIALKGELTISNAEDDVVSTASAQVMATISNQSRLDYNDAISFELWQYSDERHVYRYQRKTDVKLKLASGETTRVSCPFYGLEDGSYQVILVREEKDEEDEVVEREELGKVYFTVKKSDQTGIDGKKMPADVPTYHQGIYTLGGQKISEDTLKQHLWKRGIYIHQGKKSLSH